MWKFCEGERGFQSVTSKLHFNKNTEQNSDSFELVCDDFSAFDVEKCGMMGKDFFVGDFRFIVGGGEVILW